MKAYLCGTLEGEYVCCSVTVRSKIVTEFLLCPFACIHEQQQEQYMPTWEKKSMLIQI